MDEQLNPAGFERSPEKLEAIGELVRELQARVLYLQDPEPMLKVLLQLVEWAGNDDLRLRQLTTFTKAALSAAEVELAETRGHFQKIFGSAVIVTPETDPEKMRAAFLKDLVDHGYSHEFHEFLQIALEIEAARPEAKSAEPGLLGKLLGKKQKEPSPNKSRIHASTHEFVEYTWKKSKKLRRISQDLRQLVVDARNHGVDFETLGVPSKNLGKKRINSTSFAYIVTKDGHALQVDILNNEIVLDTVPPQLKES